MFDKPNAFKLTNGGLVARVIGLETFGNGKLKSKNGSFIAFDCPHSLHFTCETATPPKIFQIGSLDMFSASAKYVCGVLGSNFGDSIEAM